jgi:selenocysteine-specific elongation factor
MLPGFRPAPSADDQQILDRWLDRFAASPANPPSVSESQAALGAELYAFAAEIGLLVQLSEDVVFRSVDYQALVRQIVTQLDEGPATVAQIRDRLGSSRKYVLALLEHLDRQGVTVRDGDLRRLGRRPGPGPYP